MTMEVKTLYRHTVILKDKSEGRRIVKISENPSTKDFLKKVLLNGKRKAKPILAVAVEPVKQPI